MSTSENMNTNYNTLVTQLQRIADISYSSAVLNWDMETYMPPKGAARRAQQLATLSGITHEQFTSPDIGDLLEKLSADQTLDFRQSQNVKLTLKQYRKANKYTREFVEELSRCVSETFTAWQEAKQKNDFSIYAPKLEKLIALKKKECELIGYTDHPYDAMLNEYEPELKTAEVELLFNDVRKELVPFVKHLLEKPAGSQEILHRNYDKDKQFAFSVHLLQEIGYDFGAGRQDISMHPFSTNFNANDVRVTTRIDEFNLSDCLTGSIHECGHALYEQGIPDDQYGLPSGEYCSLGIHESQSRLWENNVGRSLAFWKGQFPELQKTFPEQLKPVSVEQFYAALNVVKPSLIRINADEVTYHFHVMIRFEVEKAIFENKLSVNEIPAYWNSRYKEYLGLDVPSDAEGCMQDVHWSHGSFGYFPTYSLGSFYAAQFFAKASEEIPNLKNQIEQRDYSNLLGWLREKIHRHGKTYSSKELCEKATGEPLNFKYFMDYVKSKYTKP
jgi:carboxypeptidase Taq